jgi:hypothetical protein
MAPRCVSQRDLPRYTTTKTLIRLLQENSPGTGAIHPPEELLRLILNGRRLPQVTLVTLRARARSTSSASPAQVIIISPMIPRILGEEFEAALQQASEMTPAPLHRRCRRRHAAAVSRGAACVQARAPGIARRDETRQEGRGGRGGKLAFGSTLGGLRQGQLAWLSTGDAGLLSNENLAVWPISPQAVSPTCFRSPRQPPLQWRPRGRRRSGLTNMRVT